MRFGKTGANVTFKHGHKFKPGATFDGAKVTKVYEDGSAVLADGRRIDAETGRVKGRKSRKPVSAGDAVRQAASGAMTKRGH